MIEKNCSKVFGKYFLTLKIENKNHFNDKIEINLLSLSSDLKTCLYRILIFY